MTMLLLAAIAFVGTHFLFSHPLRAPLVRATGEGAFLGIYSLVALGTLSWMIIAYGRAPTSALLWPVGDALWAVSTLMMLVASVLLAGSLIRNPALAGRARLGGFGLVAVLGGLIFWFGASWAHIPLSGWHAGIWRWLNQ